LGQILCLRYRSPFLNSSFTLLITNTDSLIYSFSFRMKERVFSFLFIFFRGKQNDFFFYGLKLSFIYTTTGVHGYVYIIRCRTNTMYTIFLSLCDSNRRDFCVHSLSKLDLRGLFFCFLKFGWDVITYIKLYLLRYFTFCFKKC